jgi:uncharacterized membrane protein
MMWAIFPILAQVFYVSGSYIQNYLVDTALPKRRPGSLIITHLPCMVISILVLFAIFGRMVFFLPLPNALGLIAAGAINIFGSIFYYCTLQAGDTADVNIIGQMSPLLSLVLGILVLGEVITFGQGIGFAIIMIAILVILFGGGKKHRHKIEYRVVVLAFCSMFFSISSDIVFAYFVKGFTTDMTLFARSFFFFQLGSALMITIIMICFGSWRKSVRSAFFTGKHHRKNLLASIVDNLLFLLADFIYKYGLLIVPVVAMMTVVGKVASLFVSLFYTIFVGKIFPKFIHGKRLTRRLVVQYVIAAVLIVIGITVMT